MFIRYTFHRTIVEAITMLVFDFQATYLETDHFFELNCNTFDFLASFELKYTKIFHAKNCNAYLLPNRVKYVLLKTLGYYILINKF